MSDVHQAKESVDGGAPEPTDPIDVVEVYFSGEEEEGSKGQAKG